MHSHINYQYIPTQPSAAEIGAMVSEVERHFSSLSDNELRSSVLLAFIPDSPKNRKQIRKISRSCGNESIDFPVGLKGPVAMLSEPGSQAISEELHTYYKQVVGVIKRRAQGLEPVPPEWISNLRAKP